jgi:hypothetical protein
VTLKAATSLRDYGISPSTEPDSSCRNHQHLIDPAEVIRIATSGL